MDKNSIIGLIVIALILVVYGIVNKPSQDEIERAKRRRDSLQRVQQQEQLDTAQRQEQQSQQTAQPAADQKQQQASEDPSTSEELREKYGSFGLSAEGEQKFIVLENSRIKARISTRGGKPWSVEL
ncbi:MAG: hypothetical protein KGY60_11700, partial [Bacteroidales bacterium]|nr:hypothetical protein [Bacteroidales bacterium]